MIQHENCTEGKNENNDIVMKMLGTQKQLNRLNRRRRQRNKRNNVR